MIGAATALSLSDIPFGGPIAGAKVGRIDGEFVLNPTHEELELSDIDLFVAGSENAIIMVEGSAREVKEEEMLEAILFGHHSLQPVIDLQKQLREAVGVRTREFEIQRPAEDLKEKVKAGAQKKLLEDFQATQKTERRDRWEEILQGPYKP